MWVITIYDTGSTNGLFVNGQLVTSKKLHTGDNVRVGNTELIFSEPGMETNETPGRTQPAEVSRPEPGTQ